MSLGVEHFEGTIIEGDTGYECEEGFKGVEQTPVAAAKGKAEPSSDAQLLADFLLKNL